MRTKLGLLVAVIGSALTALSLIGSTRAVAKTNKNLEASLAARIAHSYASAKQLFSAGDYLRAREAFLAGAQLAENAGAIGLAGEGFNNAGGAALARQDVREALPDFLKARQMAQSQDDRDTTAAAFNNLASLYLTAGRLDAAMEIAMEGLAAPPPRRDRSVRPKLRVQLASALARTGKFDEAAPIYREAIDQFTELGDLETSVRVLATLGESAIQAGRLDEAESALDEALWIIRVHRLTEYGSVLRGLAKVRALEGDKRTAHTLLEAALRAPRPAATRWMVYADRGELRLSENDLRGALDDFREARRLIILLRADVTPVDSSRVDLEKSTFGRVQLDLVESGNRLARETGDRSYIEETFEAAEQDRSWSLRALAPSANDWRSRLPAGYWDVLAQFQNTERSFLEQPSPRLRTRAHDLGLRLEQMEAAAQPDGSRLNDLPSSLAFSQRTLDSDDVIFSFLITERGAWIWAVDRTHADVYPIPRESRLTADVAAFVRSLREASPNAASLGHGIFEELFGQVAPAYLAHGRWLLELDGPLYDLPFATLVVSKSAEGPVYLAEQAALQAIPGTLLPRTKENDADGGGLLAIGDAVYNAADERFPRANALRAASGNSAVLPRLPATADELRECSLAWGPSKTHVLSGAAASLSAVQAAIANHPSVIHFATHVVPGPDRFSSGLIALSLDPAGAMGLLGPAEIVAKPVTASLVVLNGCHSDQGKTFPYAGLMGLTRAWIGAGAGAVLATRWDIPDDASKTLMADFYRELRAQWGRGPAFALQHAQLELLKNRDARQNPILLGSYFLLGRV